MTKTRHLTQQRQQNGHRHCHHYYYDNNAPLKKCRARRSLLLTMLTPSAILLWLSAIILCMTLTSTTSTVSATHLTEFVSVEAWRGSRSWRRLIDNCMSAYQILTQGVILNGQGLPASYESSGMLSSPSQQGRNRLAQNIVDYATSDDAHSAVDALTTPDMITLPTAAQALVVVFNLPGVTSKLTLTMNITARIFTGSITKWNDPAIKSLNPVVALPDENIILVVRGDPLPMNNVLHTAMSGISTEWKSMVIQADDILHWPSTINLITIKNQLSQSNTLSTVPYTIGYMWQDEAALAGIPFANFKSSTGAIIVPNADSVLFAVMEKGGVPLVQGESYLIDLTLPTGTTAWPMSHFSYVQMRTTAVRLTCSNRDT